MAPKIKQAIVKEQRIGSELLLFCLFLLIARQQQGLEGQMPEYRAGQFSVTKGSHKFHLESLFLHNA